jgi:hypothetical protein
VSMQSLVRRVRVPLAGLVLGMFLVLASAPMFVAQADAQENTSEDGGEVKKEPAEEKPSKLKAIAGYGLSIAGTFVVVAIVIHTLSKTLKYDQARNAIVHLLRSNPNQAEIQCKSLPNSFYDAIGAALKVGAMTGGVQDPAVIASATAPTFDATASVVAQHWKGLIGKAKLAMVAAVGAIILKPGLLTVPLGVLSVGGVLWLMVYKIEVDRTLFRAKVEVLPEVDRAFVDGRYYIPPKA